MNTDQEALAAYFDKWQKGWPVPDGWVPGHSWIGRDGHEEHGDWHRNVPDKKVVTPHYTEPIDIQALTGLLVVELAKIYDNRGEGELTIGSYERRWIVDDTMHSTPLCALVSAWFEVNK